MHSQLGWKRPEVLDLALICASAANIAVAWLTWVKVGASTRNSYEVFRSAQRFNLEALDPVRFAWFFAPVLTLACAVLVSIGLRRWAAGFTLVQSLFVAIVSFVVLLIGVDIGLGPVLGVTSGVGGVGVAVTVIVRRK